MALAVVWNYKNPKNEIRKFNMKDSFYWIETACVEHRLKHESLYTVQL